jgi:hypothetical protein
MRYPVFTARDFAAYWQSGITEQKSCRKRATERTQSEVSQLSQKRTKKQTIRGNASDVRSALDA